MKVVQVEDNLTLLLLFLLLLLLGRGSLGGAGGGGTGSGSSRGVLVGVGDTVLELGNGLPLVLGLESDRDEVLVAVDERVHDGGKGGVTSRQGDGGNGGDGRRESLEELALLNVEDAAGESLTLVVDLRDAHTVSEGRDVQQVEESGLGGSDLVAGLNELELSGDFNGTTGNLGGDTEGLEERGLSGLHAGVSGGDEDIGGSDGTSTSGSSDTVAEDLLTGGLEVSVGEDEADVACKRTISECWILEGGYSRGNSPLT